MEERLCQCLDMKERLCQCLDMKERLYQCLDMKERQSRRLGLSTTTHHCNGQTYDDDSDCDDDSPLQLRIIVGVTGQHCDDQFSCCDGSALRRPI